MGVSITSQEDVVALFDNTSNLAFGPVFRSEGEADHFLEWLKDGAKADRKFHFRRDDLYFLDDPRRYRTDELVELHKMWHNETQLVELNDDI